MFADIREQRDVCGESDCGARWQQCRPVSQQSSTEWFRQSRSHHGRCQWRTCQVLPGRSINQSINQAACL